MSEQPITIQMIKGQDAGGARRFLTDEQRAGRACIVCHGTDDLTEHVGWVDGISVKVHARHLENYRHGETLPPTRPA